MPRASPSRGRMPPVGIARLEYSPHPAPQATNRSSGTSPPATTSAPAGCSSNPWVRASRSLAVVFKQGRAGTHSQFEVPDWLRSHRASSVVSPSQCVGLLFVYELDVRTSVAIESPHDLASGTESQFQLWRRECPRRRELRNSEG